MKIFGNNSKTTINGKTYIGNNISINNGVVTIDGKIQDEYDHEKMEVVIMCNVDKVVLEEEVTVKGDINGGVEAKTSINCNNIKGNVIAGVSVNCDNINGNVEAGTSINCDDIGGDAIAKIINK